MTQPFTRRSFLATGAALPLALRSLAQPARHPRWIFLGTDAGPGIFRSPWDAEKGRLGTPELAIRADRPDFFAVHPSLPILYSVNSVSGAGAAVSAFQLNAASGSLQFAGKQSSRGDGPCFVSVDATGRSAYVANYSGGSFASYRLTVAGHLLSPSGTLSCKQSPACGTQGPIHERQDSSHLHCATVNPANDFVLACDLGNDSIEVFAIHPERDNPLGAARRFAARPGSGPRHLAFHPNGRWVYVIHELDCSLEVFDWNADSHGASLLRREGSVISTLAPGSTLAGNTACELVFAPNSSRLYICNRGEDSLAVFHTDPETGALTEQQRLSCGGKTPRHIAFDPTGKWLLCANQAAPGSVTVFAHDGQTGKLTGPVQTMAADTPMFVQFI